MSFRITGLSPDSFRHLFGLPDEELAKRGAKRYVADTKPGYPDRIELRDAEPGETVILLNYVHQPANTAYHASHAIFVREGAEATYDRTNEIPDAMRSRQLSLRAFDAEHLMVDAELVDGSHIEDVIERFFADPHIAYLQAHFAKRGCYAARIERS
jgi:Protein of unknown function (DUF1203)